MALLPAGLAIGLDPIAATSDGSWYPTVPSTDIAETRYAQNMPGKMPISLKQLLGLIQSDARFVKKWDDIAEYRCKEA